MRRLALRSWLLLPLLATLVVGTTLLGLFVHRAVERDLIATIDDELARAVVVRLEPEGRPPGGGGAPPPQIDDEDADAPLQVILSPDGRVIEARGGGEELAGRGLDRFVGLTTYETLDGEPRMRIASVPLTEGRTGVVALPLTDVDESLSSLRRNLAIGGVALFVAQALVIAFVVRLVNKPVGRLSTTSHRIAEGDLDSVVPGGSGPREVADLADDLNGMVGRLRSTIAEREVAASEAERAREDMERFMADASHELRTPLTALKGFSDLHAEGMLDEDGVDRAMARIGTESQRLTTLVNDLLRLLRPTDATSMEPVDLAAIASAVVHDLRAAYPDHPISLDLGTDDGVVTGDPARLHQAVLNLAANACQHTPVGTAVCVAVDRDREGVVLRVVDQGPGLDAELAERIFEPFVRGDESRSRREHDGAGLGMTITRRITEQHGGTVVVDHTPGGGTTVVLGLPAVTRAALDAGAPRPPS